MEVVQGAFQQYYAVALMMEMISKRFWTEKEKKPFKYTAQNRDTDQRTKKNTKKQKRMKFTKKNGVPMMPLDKVKITARLFYIALAENLVIIQLQLGINGR
jgi:DNA replication protein DnaD